MQRKFNVSKLELAKLILVEKLTQKQIADRYNVSRAAVQRAQKKHDVSCLYNWERKCPKTLSKLQRSVIMGSILGDDCIFRYKTTLHSSLLCYHSIAAADYVWLKFNIWKDFINYDAPKRRKRKKGTRLMFQTVCHPEFEKIRQKVYSGKKHITEEHLNNLDDISLAFWFGDDGSRCKNGGLAIHTNCFSLREVQMACKFMEHKFGYRCYPQKRKEGQWVMFFSSKTSFDFAERIITYLHPYLRYKLKGVYNYVKNPQRLYAMPFKLDKFTGKI